MPGRISGTLNFGVLWSKISNLEMWKIWGMDVEMAPYLRKYKNLLKEVYQLMKCSLLYGGLSGNILFLIFENFYVVFKWA